MNFCFIIIGIGQHVQAQPADYSRKEYLWSTSRRPCSRILMLWQF